MLVHSEEEATVFRVGEIENEGYWVDFRQAGGNGWVKAVMVAVDGGDG